MTICIAALCENSNTIILAADRMVTVGNIIEFEHDVRKIKEITNNSIVMTAGSATIQNDIITEAMGKISSLRTPNFKTITDELKKAHGIIRMKKAEEIHLKPKNLDFDTFYQNQRALLPEIVFQITDAINKSKIDVEYILCGFDADGGHINYIIDPGTSECFDTVGFCAIGTGNLNAVSVFTAHNYAPSFSIEKALYLVYLAKKEAERAPGVGDDTDIAFLTTEGINYLNKDELNELKKIYKKYIKIEEKEYKEVKDNIFNKRKESNATDKS